MESNSKSEWFFIGFFAALAFMFLIIVILLTPPKIMGCQEIGYAVRYKGIVYKLIPAISDTIESQCSKSSGDGHK